MANDAEPGRIDGRDAQAASKTSRRTTAALSVLVLCVGVLLSLPVITRGFPPRGHDSPTHEIWYECFARQHYDGEAYPRWLHEMNDGLGSPAFFYYPPAPYFAATLLGRFSSEIDPREALGLASALAIVASGLAAFGWLRRSTTAWAAAVAAILYMGMPYHFKVDLYRRGAFAELWAFVWMPLVLLFATQRAEGKRLASAGLAVSYALLVLTHLPTTLVFSPVLLAQAAFLTPSGRRLAAAWRVAGSMGLGVGLAAVYFVPAMTTQGWVSIKALGRPPSDIGTNTFFRAPGSPFRDDFTLDLFWIVLVMSGLAACCLALLRRFRPDAGAGRRGMFWFLVAAASVAMMFPVTAIVYEVFPPLRSIQFPWRFNTVLCVAVAALLAAAIPLVRRPFPTAKIVVVVAGLLLVGAWIPTTVRAVRANVRQRKGSLAEKAIERKAHRSCVPEYRPVGAPRDLRRVARMFAGSDGRSERTRVVEGRATVSVVAWRPRDLVLEIAAETDAAIEVAQLYYPGWTASSNDAASIVAKPSDTTGVVRLEVPRGARVVTLRLEPMAAERWGLYASLASLVVILVSLRPRAKGARRSRGSTSPRDATPPAPRSLSPDV